MAEQQLIVLVLRVGMDFISRMMGARMYARHGLIAPVLVVNISPAALLQPTALALPATREQPKLEHQVPRAAPPVLLRPSAWGVPQPARRGPLAVMGST